MGLGLQTPLLKQGERDSKEDFHPELERTVGAKVHLNETEIKTYSKDGLVLITILA